MAYTTTASVKAYLGITGSADDALLATLCAQAQAVIERRTRRLFECAADTTRYFDPMQAVYGRRVVFGADLCQVTSVTDNGTAVLAAHYSTLPRNTTPYYGLELRLGYAWTVLSDSTDQIAITGRWAYSVTAPDDIAFAALRLTSYMYRQKDAQVFDVTAEPGMGVITIPQGMPKDVAQILNRYTPSLVMV